MVALAVPDKQVDSVCPYCGVGCQLTYNVKDNRILFVEGRDGPANHRRLCVKGRYGFDYVQHPQRLTVPLVRRDGVPRTGMDWEIDASGIGTLLLRLTDEYGARSLYVTENGSASPTSSAPTARSTTRSAGTT